MWQSVLAMDGTTLATVAVKAFAYLASLTSAGSALVLASLSALDGDTRRMVRRLGLAGAILAGTASAALIPLGAAYLAGGSWAGATDPTLTGMVLESPAGDSLAVHLAGLAVIAGFFIAEKAPRFVAIAGAGIVCASFAFRGHVLTEPRVLLGALVTAHLLGLAFWIGAFAPLHRMAGHADPMRAGAAAAVFGRQALWVVLALATLYGRLLAVKLTLFALLLGLAAFNKLRFTPALLAGDTGAAVRLRRSISLEFAAVLAILATTATLTTIASPDMKG